MKEELILTLYTLVIFTLIGAQLYRGSIQQKIILALIALIVFYKAHQYQNSRLLVAAKNGELIKALSLLSWGARVNTSTNEGETPLMIAAAMGHTDLVKALLHKGANVQQSSSKGYTALHFAAAQGSCETITALLNAGANPLAKDSNGHTPYDYAAAYHHEEAQNCLKGVPSTMVKTTT